MPTLPPVHCQRDVDSIPDGSRVCREGQNWGVLGNSLAP
jgi:hypothetical protein